jgi:hypothetical protein
LRNISGKNLPLCDSPGEVVKILIGILGRFPWWPFIIDFFGYYVVAEIDAFVADENLGSCY